MIKTLIIDDEQLARSIVRSYLEKDSTFHLVGEAADGFEALRLIQETQPDLIFLDIQMPKISGFELLELLPEPPAVIFTTAFDQYAIKAFETNALDYLLKPFHQERFQQAVQKFKERFERNNHRFDQVVSIIQQENRIVVKDGTEIRVIPVKEVDYLEAYDDYVKIYQGSKFVLKKQTMSTFEQQLPAHLFMRIHRSFIINLDQLTRIESFEKNSYVAILRSGARIPISRQSYSVLKGKLGI